jgi:hypothetical protein
MPNYCSNTLLVHGPRAELREFAERVTSEETDEETGERFVLGFERHVPPSPDLNMSEELTDGLPDWYLWRREHWGTKWNALRPKRRGKPERNRLKYTFDTAWTPPVPWMAVVAAAHPALRFELSFQEEFDHFSGVLCWEGGILTSQEVESLY